MDVCGVQGYLRPATRIGVLLDCVEKFGTLSWILCKAEAAVEGWNSSIVAVLRTPLNRGISSCREIWNHRPKQPKLLPG